MKRNLQSPRPFDSDIFCFCSTPSERWRTSVLTYAVDRTQKEENSISKSFAIFKAKYSFRSFPITESDFDLKWNGPLLHQFILHNNHVLDAAKGRSFKFKRKFMMNYPAWHTANTEDDFHIEFVPIFFTLRLLIQNQNSYILTVNDLVSLSLWFSFEPLEMTELLKNHAWRDFALFCSY